ncbi:kinase-like domain-containing protein, partial [Mariannaea sp. PMI_226]
EQGGHHPVQLGDCLNGHYKVIHKLGSGGSANVWLCRDTDSVVSRYLAVKILMAECSTSECPELRVHDLIQNAIRQTPEESHFCLPLDLFEVDGPNGIHYAFVYPVLGPRVSRLCSIANSDNLAQILRGICKQVTEAMAMIHSNNVCHGDFRPGNILVHLSGMDGLSEEQVIQQLGCPQTSKVLTQSCESHSLPTAPQYLVYPIDWDRVLSNDKSDIKMSTDACIIDFGEAFLAPEAPEDLGIPCVYRAPELVLDMEVGTGSDIWALGCTLFEIRTGRILFDAFDDDQDEHLCKLAMLLGKFPEPW